MEMGMALAASEYNQSTMKRKGNDFTDDIVVLPKQDDETNAEYAYRTLRYNILMVILPPTSLIREADIAKKLGISKTPVHQAVSILKEQLLVDVAPQSATRVSRINVSAMRQGSLLRTEVEATTLLRMAGRLSSDYIVRLSHSLAQQRVALTQENKDIYKIVSLDDEFHRIVFQGSGQEFTWRVIKSASTHYDRVRYMGHVLGYDDLSSGYRDHEDLYKRLSFGTRLTKDQLYTFIYGHLNHYVDFFDQMVIEHPDYFDFGPVPGDTLLASEEKQ